MSRFSLPTCIFVLSSLLISRGTLYATSYTWNNVDGSWNTGTNWTPAGTPHLAGDIAIFSTISPSRTVAVDTANVTIHTMDITFSTGDDLIINGPNTIFFDNTGASLQVSGPSGTIAINPPLGLDTSFTINQDSISAFQVNSVISGTSSVSITGQGSVVFSGSSANTYVGTTSIDGTLDLEKNNNTVAIPGNVMIIDTDGQGSTLVASNQNQFNSNALTGSIVTMDAPIAIFNLQAPQAIKALVFNQGVYTTTGQVLTLTSDSTALTMRNTTIAHPLMLNGGPGGGTILFDATNNGTATISGALDLGGQTRIVDVQSGTAFVDMEISGVISNGGITKNGTGFLLFTGANTYAGGTTVSAGVLQGTSTSLQGAIANNASVVFDQTTTGTYAGAMTGTGALIKQNTGNLILSGASAITGTTTVSGGRMSVNGTLGSNGLTVGPGGTLGGTGTITSNVTVNGILAPGNSIGTLNIVGNVIQGSNSTLEIELDPTVSDRLNITGTYTIDPNATLLVVPDPGVYSSEVTYTIVDTAGGVFGIFDEVMTTLPTFIASPIYTTDQILLVLLSFLAFENIMTFGDANAVARCLDTLTPAPGSDLELVIAELRFIPTVKELDAALDLMQPSQFTALALAQENTTLYTNDTIFERLKQETQICPIPCKRGAIKKTVPRTEELESCLPGKQRAFWAAPFGGFANQRRESGDVGFSTRTGGIATGVDFCPSRNWIFGGALAYSNVHLKWKHGRGNSNMQNGYGALYASASGKHAYLFGSLIGSYNHYDTERHIAFGEALVINVDRHPKGSHHGWQGSGHLQSGLLFGKKVQFSPFAQLDYIYVHEHSFNEHGAKSLDLHVEAKNSDLLQGEAGIELSRCFSMSKNKVSPSLALSAIHEWRFKGKHEKSSFAGTSCVMDTIGMNPDRTLFSGEAGLAFLLPDENCTLAFEYKGKWGENFRDNRLLAEFLIRF